MYLFDLHFVERITRSWDGVKLPKVCGSFLWQSQICPTTSTSGVDLKMLTWHVSRPPILTPGNNHISSSKVCLYRWFSLSQGGIKCEFPSNGTLPSSIFHHVFLPKDLTNSTSSSGWIWCPLIGFIHRRCQRNLVGLRLFDGWPGSRWWMDFLQQNGGQLTSWPVDKELKMIFCFRFFLPSKTLKKAGFPEKKTRYIQAKHTAWVFSSTPFFLHIHTVHGDIIAKSLQQWMLMTPSLENCHLEIQPQWELDKSNVWRLTCWQCKYTCEKSFGFLFALCLLCKCDSNNKQGQIFQTPKT